jgi:hypothetical protein
MESSVTGDDQFEVEEWKAQPETVSERAVGVPKRVKKRSRHFVMVPRRWVDVITANSRDKTFAVVSHLLYEHWRQGGGPITVPNGMLDLDGVSRSAKWRVLNMLERAGLISIERRDRKSPIVKIKLDVAAED